MFLVDVCRQEMPLISLDKNVKCKISNLQTRIQECLYMYVQCVYWVITHSLIPNGVLVFAARTEVNSVPTVKGWRYWYKGKLQYDTNMSVVGIDKGKKPLNH